jgi:hypothetical protein
MKVTKGWIDPSLSSSVSPEAARKINPKEGEAEMFRPRWILYNLRKIPMIVKGKVQIIFRLLIKMIIWAGTG